MIDVTSGLLDTVVAMYLIVLFLTPEEIVRDLLTVGWVAGVTGFLLGDATLRYAAIQFGLLMVPVSGMLALLVVTGTPLPGDRIWRDVEHERAGDNA